jgi:hypothetical protein
MSRRQRRGRGVGGRDGRLRGLVLVCRDLINLDFVLVATGGKRREQKQGGNFNADVTGKIFVHAKFKFSFEGRSRQSRYHFAKSAGFGNEKAGLLRSGIHFQF